MKFHYYIFLFLTLWISSSYQQPMEEVQFGVRLGASATGNFQSYTILRERKNGVAIAYLPEKHAFLNYAAGTWPLPGEGRKQYLQKHDVLVFKVYNYAKNDSIWYCPALDSLWKIRYSLHPSDRNQNDGWALGGLQPSGKQLEYLHKNYGIKNVQGIYFTDSSFFKILKDVMDPEWVSNYKKLK